ncbi:uncharacterized protein LOC126742841 [Anthonomus grandis grandis]|uniref:uncharacterized protein LOC126742841 n=1 Tax=Anthonomus grandis grandis TaxID=2921223 RepID=UPI0021655F21|nr:uncharacterized protein LOC126742841 [Anthonomus grandis grandis]
MNSSNSRYADPSVKRHPVYLTFQRQSKKASETPSIQINPCTWSHISNSKKPLSDPQFDKPAPVELLLGAEIYAQVLKSGQIYGDPGQPVALDTEFGWVLLGRIHQNSTFSMSSPKLGSYFTAFDNSLDVTLRKFWELESVPQRKFLSPDEKRAEEIYQNTVSRDCTGRFTVALPFKQNSPIFGDTFSLAHCCFMSLEARLLKNPELYKLYSDFMREYISNKHMSLVLSTEPRPESICYLPHHGVIKPDSSTTKVRVVFNASAKDSKNHSFNSTLLPGPKLHADIVTILLRFRFHAIAMISDIQKMFLQINLVHEHRDYQRLLWRFSPEEPLQEYRLNTVTFGVTSSPYLAIRTLRELAVQEKNKFPRAAQVILEDSFMDDICSGSCDLESALALQKELILLLKSGGFELRKWASNDPALLSTLSPEDCQIPISFDKETPASIKILGLQWFPLSDTFSYCCNPDENCKFTKRKILSMIAKIWDP